MHFYKPYKAYLNYSLNRNETITSNLGISSIPNIILKIQKDLYDFYQ